jgi:hypothetical protein
MAMTTPRRHDSACAASNSFQALHSALVLNVARVQCRSGLEQEHMGFFFGNRLVLHSLRHDQKLPLLEPDVPIAKLHAESALNYEEKLVFVVVVMPNERPLKLHELDLLAVQLTDNLRLPVLGEEGELLSEVDFFHKESSLAVETNFYSPDHEPGWL